MKKTILCIHGALGCSQSFQDWILWCQKHDSQWFNEYNWHFIDLDGHGGNRKEITFSIDYFVENIAEYIRVNQIETVSIFGYSMGGYIALEFALNYPKQLEQIITLGTKFDWNPASSEHEVRFLNPALIEEKVPAYAKQLQAYHGEKRWKYVLEQTKILMLNLGALDRIGKESWKNTTIPVTLLRAENDAMVTEGESRFVAEHLLEEAQFYTIPGKHGLDTIDYAKLNEILRNKLK